MHRVIPLLLGGGSRQVICWKSQRWQKPFFDLPLLKTWRQWFFHKEFLNVRNRLSPAWPRGEEEYFVDDGGESLEDQGRVHQVLRRAPETSAVEVREENFGAGDANGKKLIIFVSISSRLLAALVPPLLLRSSAS